MGVASVGAGTVIAGSATAGALGGAGGEVTKQAFEQRLNGTAWGDVKIDGEKVQTAAIVGGVAGGAAGGATVATNTIRSTVQQSSQTTAKIFDAQGKTMLAEGASLSSFQSAESTMVSRVHSGALNAANQEVLIIGGTAAVDVGATMGNSYVEASQNQTRAEQPMIGPPAP